MTTTTALIAAYALMIALAVIEERLDSPAGAAARRERWPANIVLAIFNGAVASFVPISAVTMAATAQAQGFGLLNVVAAPYWLVVIVTIAVISCVGYATHVALHKIPWLWALHRIHHCDTTPDSTTALRHHPVEVLFGAAVTAPIVFVLGLDPIAATVLAIVDLVFAIVTHSPTPLPKPLERVLGRVFTTPSLHRIHHSQDWRETDTNYAVTFIILDRIFGTYRAEPLNSPATFRPGLREIPPAQAADLDYLLLLPIKGRLPKRKKGAQAVQKER